MEYVQTVLVQIAATKLDEASGPQGLLTELEAHRDFASAQRGFQGMRLTRTANPEGNVLVVVETRWSNNNTMADYSTLKNNVAAIIEKHSGETVPGSLQVHRMEAVTSDRGEASAQVYDRLSLALLIPVGVMAFALLVVFLLSRIYLTLPGDAATPLAAGIAIGVLLIAWYFSANPTAPRWQPVGLAGLIAVFLLVVGGWAYYYDDNNHEVKAAPEPVKTASAATGSPVAAGAAEIVMEDNKFVETAITVKSGETIKITNNGTAIHNVHIGPFTASFCKAAGPDPCSKPANVPGGTTASLGPVTLAAGTYDFQCDFHPLDMQGKLTVQ